MRLFVLRAAVASLLIAAPAAAMPGFDKLQISLEGQAQGWLQACTYYGLGWLEPEKATGPKAFGAVNRQRFGP